MREGDPGAANKPGVQMTFEEAVRKWHGHRLDALGGITPSDVLAMVRRVEVRGALDVSRPLKQHASQIYRFAIPQGWAERDSAEHLEQLLKPKPRTRHMTRIGPSELPELIRAIDGDDGDETPRRRAVTRTALLFTLLTWARTNETRHASWDEFEDLNGASPLWRVRAERMKMAREHVVPLAPAVVALLKDVRRYSSGRYVFAGEKPDQPISQNTMIYASYRMGYRARQTVHGFRGLASTWANEAECYRPDWIEMALAHVERDEVRGAYNAALYLTPRRRMLADWADTICGMMDGKAAVAADMEAVPQLECMT